MNIFIYIHLSNIYTLYYIYNIYISCIYIYFMCIYTIREICLVSEERSSLGQTLIKSKHHKVK